MQKVTIKEQFVEVAEVLRNIEREDLAEFIEGRIAILDKKSENKKATAKQNENEGIKADILARLEGRSVTVGELVKEMGFSSQKLSALLTQLVKGGEVVRTVEKKVAYFSLA